MRINTNVASLNAQAQGSQTNTKLSSSLEKLSSGLRINKASDDASGMSIADKLRTQASSIGQGISNANSGSALIQIADKAMSEQSNILDIVKTKLIQASTSTTSAEGREAIRKDVQKLLEQLDNISAETNYNGVNLLNEKGAEFSFQVGEDSSFDIGLTAAFAVNTEGLGSSDREFANSAVVRASAAGQAIGGLALEGEATDAKLNIKTTLGSVGVTIVASMGASVNMSGDGVTAIAGGGVASLITTNNAEDIAFLNAQADATTTDGLTKLADGVYALTAASGTFTNGAAHDFEALTFSTGSAGATFTMTGASNSSIQKINGTADIAVNNAIEATIDGDSAEGIAFGAAVMVTDGTIAIEADVATTNGAVAINTVAATSSSGNAELELSLASEKVVQSISMWNTSGASMVILSTTDGDTASALETAGLTKSLDGSYEWSANSTGSTLNFAGSGIEISNLTVSGLTKNTAGTETIYVETKGAVTVENLKESAGNTDALQNGIGVQVSTINTVTGITTAAVATGFSASAVDSGLGASQLSGLMALGENKLTAETANNFMSVIDDAMTQLNSVRSDFGSTQGQLEVATRNMMSTQVNLKAAESVIRDVDYAAESANFNKQNIIAQAGTYAMSQANAMQQNVLRLLQ